MQKTLSIHFFGLKENFGINMGTNLDLWIGWGSFEATMTKQFICVKQFLSVNKAYPTNLKN